MHLILCGHQYSGKSTLAKAYSETFGVDYIDTDNLISQAFQAQYGQKASIRQVYTQLGACAFRDLEREVIAGINCAHPAVIATGGGAVIDPRNVAALHALGRILYLHWDHDRLYERLRQRDSLPCFISNADPAAELRAYLRDRHTIYQQVSDDTIEATDTITTSLVAILHEYWSAYGK